MDYDQIQLNPHDVKLDTILIDFDHTLLNFDVIEDATLTRIAECYHLDFAEMKALHSNAKENGVYFPERHAKLISELLQNGDKDYEIILELFYSEYYQSYKYKYDDVDEFFVKNHLKYNIYVFSLGAEEFQIIKRECLEIDKFLRGAIYTKKPKAEIINAYYSKVEWLPKDRSIIFIDDRPKLFDEVQIMDNFKFVRLKRVGGKYENEIGSREVRSIRSLGEFGSNSN